MAITLTPVALERVQRFVEQTPAALGLRFGVTAPAAPAGATVRPGPRRARGRHRVRVRGREDLRRATSLPLVDGTEIDFARQGLSETFIFRNPNAAAECGCGESFTTTADAA